MSERTPGPWRWSDEYKTLSGEPTWSLIGADGFGVLSCDGMPNSPQNIRQKDADDILKAVNNHDKLVEALTDALRWMDGFDDRYLVKDDYGAKLNARALLSSLNDKEQGA